MSAIREWAKDQGQEVKLRGRLPKSLIVDYLMAHPAEARQFIADSGIKVGHRGRISKAKVIEAVG
jgi:hypothetical protein